jgi:hypothetical protein
MPPMPDVMSIGAVFALLSNHLDDGKHMVEMLDELRDPAVKRLSDMHFFNRPDLPPWADGVTIASHIETDWFGWDPETGVQDGFDPDHPVPTGWWTAWHGNADKITRETLTRVLEVALGVPHDSNVITPTRRWRITFDWTCGTLTFEGRVVWQCATDDETKGCVLCTFTTPRHGDSSLATPYHPETRPAGNGSRDSVGHVETRGSRVIGDRCTEILLPNSEEWIPVTGELADCTNAFVYTHELPDDEHPGYFVPGVAVVSPADEPRERVPFGTCASMTKS